MVRPGGVNRNDKTVMINPPGAYHNGGGAIENLTPAINAINPTRLQPEKQVGRLAYEESSLSFTIF